MVNVFQRLTVSLRGHGLMATLAKIRVLLADYWFDFRYGVDTCSWSELEGLTIASDNRARGNRYQPTRLLLLRRLFKAVEPALPADRVLVDFGSGKGRVLLVASEFGFREARGVEFAHELCETSRRNVTRYKARTRVRMEFSIIESDAARYQIRPEENVFILCNPFDGTILKAVLDNITASIQKHPRKVWIMYYNPRWSQVVEQQNDFARFEEFTYWGFKFIVYSSRC